MTHFTYGKPFLEINSQLLKRYAACKDEEEVKKTEEAWLKKLEKEYAKSRSDGDDEDVWAGGNTNRREVFDSEDEEEDGDGSEEDDDDGDLQLGQGVSLDMPPSEDEEEAAEMAEIRRKILASRPFADSVSDPKPEPAPSIPPSKEKNPEVPPQQLPLDSDAESGSAEEDYDDFDQITNATPVTDKTGIVARERAKKLEVTSASFSRVQISAPKKW